LQRKHDPEDNVERRGLVLSELGPRINLKLIKIEEGLCQGKVIWHDFVTKTREEEKEMDTLWEKRLEEKEDRRRIQRQNVERKKKERQAQKVEKGDQGDVQEEDDEMEDYEEWEDYLDRDDDELMGEIEAA